MIHSIDSLPTVTTFQQIIRYVSLGARLSTLIKGSNVDSSCDQMNLLVIMSKCLHNKAKECDISSSDPEEVLEDQLLKELTIRFVNTLPEPSTNDFVNNILVYRKIIM